MVKYKIWDKLSNIKTPSGEVLSAEDWKNRYPVAREDDSVIILSNSYFDGAIFEELHMLQTRCESMGASFTDGLSDQELLSAIEHFEDEYRAAQQASAEAAVQAEAEYAAESLAAEQAVAGALVYQNMMNY